MKHVLVLLFMLMSVTVFAQSRINPVINGYGGIFDIPYAVEKPDPTLDYNIVIEIATPSDNPDSTNWALYNVARLVNLHVWEVCRRKNCTWCLLFMVVLHFLL